MQLLRAQATVAKDDATRDALLALVARIAALPPCRCRSRRRPHRVRRG
jgi:hypothetical protein